MNAQVKMWAPAVCAALWLTACVSPSSGTGGGDPVTLGGLLSEMLDRDAPARLPDAPYTAVQFSSYDRRSTTPQDRKTWFGNQDFNNFRRVEKNGGMSECVMAEAQGPGALVKLWVVGSTNAPDDMLRIYLDGNPQPAIRASMRQLTDGAMLAGFPFATVVPPTAEPQWKARNLYLPIPFAKSIRITREGTLKTAGLFYYHAQLRLYRTGTPVETFSDAGLKRAEATIRQAGAELAAKPGPDGGGTTLPLAAELPPGAVREWKLSGPAAIRRLSLRLAAGNMKQALHSTLLEIEFDGERTVCCPAGYFMGTGAGVHEGGDRYREVQADGTMTASWTMPFAKSATMRLRNLGAQPVRIDGSLMHGPWKWDERSLHFHAVWRSFGTLDAQKIGKENVLWDRTCYGCVDLPFVEVSGAGRLVGDNIALMNGGTDWWGEGDEKISVDGEAFPSFFGTGTEDYYGYAWCLPQPFRTPFGGQPTGGGNKKSGYTVNCRVRLLDDIPFTKSCRMTMELLHSQPARINYTAATFFYARPGARVAVPDPEAAAKNPAPETPADLQKVPVVTSRDEIGE